jgi:hypothetical protein
MLHSLWTTYGWHKSCGHYPHVESRDIYSVPAQDSDRFKVGTTSLQGYEWELNETCYTFYGLLTGWQKLWPLSTSRITWHLYWSRLETRQIQGENYVVTGAMSENWTKHVALFTDYLSDDIKLVGTIHMSNHVTSKVFPHRDSTDSRWKLRRMSANWTKHIALFTDYLLDDIKVTSTIHTSNHVMSIVISPQHSMDSKWELCHCRGCFSQTWSNTYTWPTLCGIVTGSHKLMDITSLRWEQCHMRVCEWHLNSKISNIHWIRVIQFFWVLNGSKYEVF